MRDFLNGMFCALAIFCIRRVRTYTFGAMAAKKSAVVDIKYLRSLTDRVKVVSVRKR